MEILNEINLTPQSFTFYTSVAVISSSRIEGEQLEVDSYVKHKMQDIEYLPELVEKPNDLFHAYLFAKENKLTKENFLHAHALLSKHLLSQIHFCRFLYKLLMRIEGKLSQEINI